MKHKEFFFENGNTAKINIRASFSNTLIVAVDAKNNAICWCGTQKSGHHIRHASEEAGKMIAETLLEFGITNARIEFSGPGTGLEPAIQAIKQAGINISSIKDTTPVPHNGCIPYFKKEQKN